MKFFDYIKRRLLSEGKVSNMTSQFPRLTMDQLHRLASYSPRYKNDDEADAYVMWLATFTNKAMKAGKTFDSVIAGLDEGEVKRRLKQFDAMHRGNKAQEIMRVKSLQDLAQQVDSLGTTNKTALRRIQMMRRAESAGGKLVFQDQNFMILALTNRNQFDAMRIFGASRPESARTDDQQMRTGRNSNQNNECHWCTTNSSGSFESYIGVGPLYVILILKNGEFYLLNLFDNQLDFKMHREFDGNNMFGGMGFLNEVDKQPEQRGQVPNVNHYFNWREQTRYFKWTCEDNPGLEAAVKRAVKAVDAELVTAMNRDLNIGEDGVLEIGSNNNEYVRKYARLLDKLTCIRLKERFNPAGLFHSTFLTKIQKLDLNGCTTITQMFAESTIRQIGEIVGAQNVENAADAFNRCGNLVFIGGENFDMPRCKNTTQMFLKCSSLESLPPSMRLDACEGAQRMFEDCRTLQHVPELGSLNITRAERVSGMFDGCGALEAGSTQRILEPILGSIRDRIVRRDDEGFIVVTSDDQASELVKIMPSIPQPIDIKVQVESAAGLFSNARGLNKIRKLDLTGVQTADDMFSGSSISEIEEILNAGSLESADEMFARSKIQSAPDIDFPTCLNTIGMFRQCVELTHVGAVKLPAVKDITDMFRSCEKLTDAPEFDFGQSPRLKKCNNVFADCAARNPDAQRAFRDKQAEFTGIAAQGVFRTDDRGYLIVDDDLLNDSHAMVMLKDIVARYPGIKIETTDQEWASNVFATYRCGTIRVEQFPKVDLNGRHNAQSMFQNQMHIISFAGFENADHLKNASQMFYSCNSLRSIPEGIVWRSLKHVSHMFAQTSIREIGDIDMPDVQISRGMFYSCSALRHVGTIKAHHVQTADSMFMSCSNLEEIRRLEMPMLTSAQQMFDKSGIKAVPDGLTFENLARGNRMFQATPNLKRIPKLVMPALQNAMLMFDSSAIEFIGQLSIPAVTRTTKMFCRSKLQSILRHKINPNMTTSAKHMMFYSCPAYRAFGKNGERFT